MGGIQPSNPKQKAHIELHNRTIRYDWLNQHLFSSIKQALDYVTAWLWAYNNERPNMGIGEITLSKNYNLLPSFSF